MDSQNELSAITKNLFLHRIFLQKNLFKASSFKKFHSIHHHGLVSHFVPFWIFAFLREFGLGFVVGFL
ncbi:MAG: hypothetical protein KGP29_06500, partial [Proteobacteria bacterium]|nr:hypothetical protein [Pseudomonadota bacterium]